MMITVGTGAMFVGASFALGYYRPAAVDRLQANVPVVFGGLTFLKDRSTACTATTSPRCSSGSPWCSTWSIRF